MNVSIDTNAYRAFTDGDPVISNIVRKAEIIGFSSIVLGELRAGFLRGTRAEHNENLLKMALMRHRVQVHDVTESTSNIYARVWNELRTAGRPIPTNDLWIAAQCLERGFCLVTLDRHFEAIQELKLLP